MSTPYIGFGNNTLAGCPTLKDGDMITCPKCGEQHQVKESNPPMLLSFRCGDSTYMAGVNGRSTMGVRADVSGKVEP